MHFYETYLAHTLEFEEQRVYSGGIQSTARILPNEHFRVRMQGRSILVHSLPA